MASLAEVEKASLEYFQGDELAANVFGTKYALTDNKGNILELTPDDMHHRLAREFARIESKYKNAMSEDEIFDLLKGFKKIVPQGSPMAAVGNPYQIQSLSNCFVVEAPYDSYGGICYVDQKLVQIAKRRGGIGFDISSIRPKGMPTANAAKTTDGIESFMDRYSNSCREVAQNGRRGALMLTLSVHHPQVRDFIRIKRNRDRVTGANISLRLSDEFLNAVEQSEKYQLRFPVDSREPIFEEWVDAREIWDQIIESAHGFAEPGLLFWDSIIRNSPADIYAQEGFKTVSTNPCAELPLAADDSCRLLVINILTFVRNPFTSKAKFDFVEFASVVEKAQRIMDDLIDLEIEQIDKIIEKVCADPEPDHIKRLELDHWTSVRAKAAAGRRTGLGVTAVGDAVAALGMRYGSDESIDMVERFYKTLCISAYRSSSILAKERGAFPIHDHQKEIGHPFLEKIWNEDPEIRDMSEMYGRRNIALLTTAPGGSVSVETQTTSGIEPAYLVKYTRRKKVNDAESPERIDFIDQSGDKWTEYEVFHHGFKQWMDVTGKTDPKESPYWKSTSDDIDWVQKVKLQAAAQRWVDHAISNTTNVPADTPVEVVKEIYMTGWKSGCKGVTVYREGSRTGVLVSHKSEDRKLSESNVDASASILRDHHAPKRPTDLPCDIHQVNISGEAWTILVGLMNGRPYEIMGGLSKFVEIPKKHKCGVLIKRPRKLSLSIYDLVVGENGDEFKIKNVVDAFENPNYSSFTRVLSLSLRHGAPINYIVEQLQKGDKDMDLFSFSKVIGRVLKKYVDDGTKPGGDTNCPHCGGADSLRYAEGCVMCTACSYGKC